MHWTLLLLCVVVSAFDEETKAPVQCDGSTVECRSRSELVQLIRAVQQENREIKAAVDPNCTVCWSAPCLNFGTCEPLSVNNYRCYCPEDFGGRVCEVPIVCKPNSCGKNAHCYVANHQINCVCNLGFSGDPKYGCGMKIVEACMDGDPHYKTYDGQRYEYQGTCPYLFTAPCNRTIAGAFNYFSVKAKNELSYARAHVSTVSEVEVEMYAQTIHVDKDYHLYVNGVRMKMPYYYPSKKNAKITVQVSWFKVQITNDQYVTIKFGLGQLCVQIPSAPQLTGSDKLCGLAGNYDSNCKDDFRHQDGVVDTVNSCSNRNQMFTEKFGDTWITDDFLPMKSGDPEICLKGAEVANQTLQCDLVAAKQKCQILLDVAKGTGAFAACKGLSDETLENAYENCWFDTCLHGDLYCSSLATFARICQYSLPNVPLDWRKASGCPEIHCNLHAHYAPCAGACPATCSNHEITTECGQGCSEGCECDVGYVLDYSLPKDPKCIKVEDCGCTDNDGNVHGPKDVWLTKNCTESNYCSNGTFHTAYKPCSKDGYCGIGDDYDRKCKCKDGFVGDGYKCVDVNECEDPRKCSQDKGQGTCTNTAGSYHCSCNGFYGGRDCERYLPERHCADLFVYHKKTKNGVYTIKPPYRYNNNDAYTPVEVYCDMERGGGGWTMMANSIKDSMANKTFAEYVAGFGDPSVKDLWLGLDLIYGMTKQVQTSLRLNLHRCAHNRQPETFTDCTYPKFWLMDSSEKYAVVIPEQCYGTEMLYYDGWARWDLTKTGPVFLSYDSDNSKARCSETYLRTGWWFDTTTRCGYANLNGIRYKCSMTPSDDEIGHYLHWNGNPLSEIELYLRPEEFPKYDPGHF